VAVAVHGGQLFVADHHNHRIDVYATDSHTMIRSFGEPGSGDGALYYPSGVAVDASGSVYVADTLNARVQVFDAQGGFVRTIGRPAEGPGVLGKPKGIAVAGSMIAVADAEFARIYLFDTEGRLLLLVGGPADQPGGTPLPSGLAITPALPDSLRPLIPPDFDVDSLLWVSNTTGTQRLSLFAIGRGNTPVP
jgi:DNA-binding beta-propeller fold protein YncE